MGKGTYSNGIPLSGTFIYYKDDAPNLQIELDETNAVAYSLKNAAKKPLMEYNLETTGNEQERLQHEYN